MAPKLRSVTRLDSMPVNQTFYTPEGYLIDKPILTSTGIFEYADFGGNIRRELRLPEDVFDAESLASYEGKPIIITHDAGLVDKNNIHEHQVGTILSAGIRSGEDVRAKIIIHDTDEMKERGLKELSLGYNLDLDETPGVWNGMAYDAIQKNIRINHLALVDEARAGEQARLNIDSRDGVLKGGKVMRKKGTRNDSVLSPEELSKAIEEYKARHATEAADADDTDDTVVPEAEVVEPVNEDADSDPVKAFLEKVKKAREEKQMKEDAEEIAGGNDELESAKATIEEMRADMQKLLDIIDTLMAEKEFDSVDMPEEEMGEELIEDDADEMLEEPEEEIAEDAEDIVPEEVENVEEELPEEEITEDAADEEIEDLEAEEAEETEMDEEDVEEEVVEEELSEEENTDSKCRKDSVDYIVKETVKAVLLGRQLNLDGLENKSLREVKKDIISSVRPNIRLDGKSNTYIDAMYEMAVDEINSKTRKGTDYQRKQMFNKDSADTADENSAEAARQRMIERRAHK